MNTRTAPAVLSAVQTAIAQHAATRVTIVGHSLGAAIALLDGIFLPLHIGGVTFRTIGYGTPRVIIVLPSLYFLEQSVIPTRNFRSVIKLLLIMSTPIFLSRTSITKRTLFPFSLVIPTHPFEDWWLT